MNSSPVYTADRIFTGESWLTNHAIVVEDDRIHAIVPVSQLSSNQPVKQFDGCFIAPAFIDLQIYGAGGKLFSVYPDMEALEMLQTYCNEGGAAFCLPTVATNTRDVFFHCIDAVKKYWENNGRGILGLHLEGPWINPQKRGAHIERLVHQPSLAEVDELLEYGKGVIKMITLAPEVCSKEVIDLILSHGIVISAGHSNANYAEAKQGFAQGIKLATHLFNAMSQLLHREPGLVGAVMDDEKVMASIIPDGYHVDYAVLRIAKSVMKERLFVITDAVTTTGQGEYQHQLAGDKYEAAGILSGSALTMNRALENLVVHGKIEMGDALRMCSLYPARALGMDNELGMILPGYICRMVVLDNNLHVVCLI